MRIIPYIIGIIAGYILVKLNNNLILKKVKYCHTLLFTLLSITYYILNNTLNNILKNVLKKNIVIILIKHINNLLILYK